ncbi:MAG: helix-turn-helix domain-containing protein [Terriglobales bacterium]|jgi:uncharacterized protein YdbL (DUF1318 family)
MAGILFDDYVMDVLMRDLVGHDKKPSAFLVYLFLAARLERDMTRASAASYGRIAACTGLSKTAVQQAIAHLAGRKLINIAKRTASSIPVYSLNRHWRRRLS